MEDQLPASLFQIPRKVLHIVQILPPALSCDVLVVGMKATARATTIIFVYENKAQHRRENKIGCIFIQRTIKLFTHEDNPITPPEAAV